MGNIFNPRAGCALHGALATLGAIEGVVPIVHANAGCAMQHHFSRYGGGYIEGLAVPASNIIDKQVIFGGGARLREQIKNTAKVVDGHLYVALGGCECAMVGDDLAGMAREAVEQGLPTVASNVAGFQGDVHHGHERVMRDLIDALPERESSAAPHPEDGARPLVNLLGIFPGADPHYKGDLEEMRRILEGIGLRANSLFGPDGAAALRELPHAALNLVFSRWGEAAAIRLEERYGTPALIFEAAPVGIEEVSIFVQMLVEKFDLDAAAAERFLEREEALADYFLLGVPDRHFDEAAGKTVAIVADTGTALRIGGFLARFFGADIAAAVLTDRAGDEKLPDGLAREVRASRDTGEIAAIIATSGADIVLGSSLEEPAARAIGARLLPVSHPVLTRTIAHKTYAGLRGALTLTEDYLTLAGEDTREREARLWAKIAGRATKAA